MSSEPLTRLVITSQSGTLTPTREVAVRERIEAAQRMLDAAGITYPAPSIVLDAVLPSPALASTVDAGSGSAILLSPAGESDLDVILHELVHVWMRANGPHQPDPRWRLDDGVATHASAMIHEGVADFVVAALTHDPIIAERSTEPGLARSVRIAVSCPEGLVGQPHHDAMIVAGALWQVADGNPSDVIAALVTSAPRASQSLPAFVGAMHDALEARSAPLAARWSEVVTERGLLRCAAPITIDATRVAARADDFLAVGTTRFDVAEVAGPLTFRTPISGAAALTLTARSTRAFPPLEVDWRAELAGITLARGRTPLAGWPSQSARLAPPAHADALMFAFVNTGPDDVAFNDVSITRSTIAVPEPTVPSGGCAALGTESAMAALLAWVVCRRCR